MSHTFTSAVEGYGNTEMERTFYIVNTGTGTLTGLAAAITTGNAAFEISTALSGNTVNPGEMVTVGIRPVTGLATGTHNGVLTVTGNNGINLTVNLSFEVNTAPDPAGDNLANIVLSGTPSGFTFSGGTYIRL